MSKERGLAAAKVAATEAWKVAQRAAELSCLATDRITAARVAEQAAKEAWLKAEQAAKAAWREVERSADAAADAERAAAEAEVEEPDDGPTEADLRGEVEHG